MVGLISAADGYEVLYALPKIDLEFTNQVITLAIYKDGEPLTSQLTFGRELEDRIVSLQGTGLSGTTLILITSSINCVKEAEGKYETTAPADINEWIKMRIEVNGPKAYMFINDARYSTCGR